MNNLILVNAAKANIVLELIDSKGNFPLSSQSRNVLFSTK